MLLEIEFAMGLWQGYQASCWRRCFCAAHPYAGEGKGFLWWALRDHQALHVAAKEEMPGDPGAEAQDGHKEGGVEKGLRRCRSSQMYSNYHCTLPYTKRTTCFPPKSCLLGCFAMCRADTEANLAEYLEGIWDILFMK